MIEIEKVLLKEKPDRVMVYGDTNSTLAGALAAAKLHIPVAHVEAGLRSFNMRMPEEVNRILTDQLSDLLLCPTDAAIENLEKEGFLGKTDVTVEKVGDVMQDSAMLFSTQAVQPVGVKNQRSFILVTLHRAENTDSIDRLRSIVSALNEIHNTIMPVVMPLHPRTKKVLDEYNLTLEVDLIDPVGYLEMIWLLQHCALVLTDSGGVQQEAFFFAKPCVTMRDQTEWVELIDAVVNQLVGANHPLIINAVQESLAIKVEDENELYGGGTASKRIVELLK